MPVVEVCDIVRASLEETYAHICNPEEYALLFPEVSRVLVVEKLPQGARTFPAKGRAALLAACFVPALGQAG